MTSEPAYDDLDDTPGLWFHDAMRVGLLGPLVAQGSTAVIGSDDHGAPGELRSVPRGQRARDVLAVLVQRRGRPVPPEVVLDLVWGDEAVRIGGVAVVHTVVARLRRQFGADAVRTHDSGYLVNARTHTDEDDVTDELETARRHADRGEFAEAAAHYRGALTHWRGVEAFGGVGDHLVAADRSRLAELRAQAIESLVGLVLAHLPADLDDAVERAVDLAREYPLRERAHQLAMLALFAHGRQAEALDVYRRLRLRLRTELGVDPGPSTQEVHRRVLAHHGPQAEPMALPAASVGIEVPRLRTSCLPTPVSPLIGRETELATLRQAIRERRLVTLVGPGGVGKSRILAELGFVEGRGRSVYSDLSGLDVASTEDLADIVALSHRVPVTAGGAVAALVTALQDTELLMLVDEAEWVIEPLAELLRILLDQCPGTRAVVTSRRPLELVGERVLALDPLRLPEPRESTAVKRDAAAVRLLADRLADRELRLGTDPQDIELAVAIAAAVDGLPLGLELVAAHAGARTLPELAALVDAPLDLAATRRSGNVRHGSLRSTLSWSLSRLGIRQRVVLGRLSVFAGRFDLEAAAAVADVTEAEAVVAELARDALVLVDRSGPARLSFRLLRTVRQLAAAEIGDGELAAARRRHRQWYAARWRGAPRRDDLISDVRDSYEEYLAALSSSLADGDGGAMADLVLTLSRFWLFADSRRPGLRWTTRVMESGLLSARQRALVRAQRAALALHHDRDLVLADTAAALPALLADGETSWAVTALIVRALELSSGGVHDEALACARQGVEIADQVTVERRADALGVLAVVQASAGLAEEAEQTIAAAWQAVTGTGSAAARIAVAATSPSP